MRRKTFIPFDSSRDHSIDYLLGILEDARITTLDRVDKLTTDEVHWQYHPDWNSIGALLSHMISCDHLYRIHYIGGRALTDAEVEAYEPGLEMGKYIPSLITDWDIAEYLTRLEISREKLVAEIKKLSAEDFHRKREGYNPATGYNLAWSLYHLAEDEVHHRGQISMIRKLYKAR
jgi:uncharacterized damage-inducible protein DinB